jgi:hypothetical protein
LRTVATSFQPLSRNSRAVAVPMPLLAPSAEALVWGPSARNYDAAVNLTAWRTRREGRRQSEVTNAASLVPW